MSKYTELALALKTLEKRIFVHAYLKQIDTIQSFLLVAVRKSKLENEITLLADLYDSDILKKKVKIIICAQNEIPNITHVEKTFASCLLLKFEHLQFLKFIEYLEDGKDLDELSTTITSANQTVVKVGNLKFHVAKHGSDEYGRSIKLIVYTNEIIDELLKPTKEEDHWIPDANLFYLLDRVFGEYYMTKHITTINFFPINIMPTETQFLSASEAKENIDVLLKLEHKKCLTCGVCEYRTLLDDKTKCVNCKM